jgi:hypothetical protein
MARSIEFEAESDAACGRDCELAMHHHIAPTRRSYYEPATERRERSSRAGLDSSGG